MVKSVKGILILLYFNVPILSDLSKKFCYFTTGQLGSEVITNSLCSYIWIANGLFQKKSKQMGLRIQDIIETPGKFIFVIYP